MNDPNQMPVIFKWTKRIFVSFEKKNEKKQIRFYFYKAQHEFSSLAGYSIKKTQCKTMKSFTQKSVLHDQQQQQQ